MLIRLNIQRIHIHLKHCKKTTMHDKDSSIHDEYDTSEDENIIEIETIE